MKGYGRVPHITKRPEYAPDLVAGVGPHQPTWVDLRLGSSLLMCENDDIEWPCGPIQCVATELEVHGRELVFGPMATHFAPGVYYAGCGLLKRASALLRGVTVLPALREEGD